MAAMLRPKGVKMPQSHPLDVFVTTDTDRKILDIFAASLAVVSPRKRKTATTMAVSLLRTTDAPKFANALAIALTSIEKADEQN
jgi:hypothetical protein